MLFKTMLFRRDHEQERGIWVDRGIDGRVDGFALCDPCNEALDETDPLGKDWHDAQDEMCPSCRTDFAAHALLVDLFGLRGPFNGEMEDRRVTNDETAEQARPGLPEAFNYVLPDREEAFTPGQGDGLPADSLDSLLSEHGDAFESADGDGFLPGHGDAFGPAPGDRFLPGYGDAFGPPPGDRFLPGYGDAFGPAPGDGFLPGYGDAFGPGPGDAFLPALDGREPNDYFVPGMEDYLLPE